MSKEKDRQHLANNEDSVGLVEADKRSVRSGGAGDRQSGTARDGKTDATSQHTTNTMNSSETRLSELADIDRQFKNRFVQFWLHTKISVRLIFILTVPIAALIILLVIVLSAEVRNGIEASKVVRLATLVDNLVQVVREMSTEHTDSLWWNLDKNLKSGITWTTGGISGKGLQNKLSTTDVEIAKFKISSADAIRAISPRLADKLSTIRDTISTLNDLRYKVQRWRVTADEVDAFFMPLIDHMLDAIDLASILSDVKTLQSFQSLATWVRAKTAQERERHVIGQVILLKQFSLDHFSDWLAVMDTETHWRNRFLAIAPKAWRKKVLAYFVDTQARALVELRLTARESFVPNNPSSYPKTIPFKTWMDNSTMVNNFYREVRRGITAEIVASTTNRKQTSTTALSLYVLLAVLSGFLSMAIGLAVGWSIDSPWNAMLRMKDRMFEKLREEEQRNVIVNQFVPSDFFAMMGVKSLFEVQLGQCMLKRATVVCNEIRNFSKLSERMAPQQNFQFLSMWLQDNGPVVRRHGGFIEKFRGTGLTAIFADPNDALDAGLELLEAIRVRNSEAANASVQIETGIAIHTGDLMLGTVGDQMRMETAIISEALATALQMVKVMAAYQTTVAVSRDTFVLLNVEGLSTRFLGEFGSRESKLHPQIYEVLQPNDESKLSTLNEFSQAIKFHQDGEFEKAIGLYESILEQDPTDWAARRRKALAQTREWVDFM